MKKLQLGSLIIIAIAITNFYLERFVFIVPGWVVRTTGIIMVISIFALAFSTARLFFSHSKQNQSRK